MCTLTPKKHFVQEIYFCLAVVFGRGIWTHPLSVPRQDCVGVPQPGHCSGEGDHGSQLELGRSFPGFLWPKCRLETTCYAQRQDILSVSVFLCHFTGNSFVNGVYVCECGRGCLRVIFSRYVLDAAARCINLSCKKAVGHFLLKQANLSNWKSTHKYTCVRLFDNKLGKTGDATAQQSHFVA